MSPISTASDKAPNDTTNVRSGKSFTYIDVSSLWLQTMCICTFVLADSSRGAKWESILPPLRHLTKTGVYTNYSIKGIRAGLLVKWRSYNRQPSSVPKSALLLPS